MSTKLRFDLIAGLTSALLFALSANCQTALTVSNATGTGDITDFVTVSGGTSTTKASIDYLGDLVLNGTLQLGPSGTTLIVSAPVSGTPTWTPGSMGGTPVVAASAPLAITTSTGNITCASCLQASNVGAAFSVTTGATAVSSVSSITNKILGSFKATHALTAQNITGSAVAISCAASLTFTFYDCGSSTSCSSSTTIGSVTVSGANVIDSGTISNASIANGDFVVGEITNGTCTSVTGASASLSY